MTFVPSYQAEDYIPRRPLPFVSVIALPIVKFVAPKLPLLIPSALCTEPLSRMNRTTSSSLLDSNTFSSCCFDGLPRMPCVP